MKRRLHNTMIESGCYSVHNTVLGSMKRIQQCKIFGSKKDRHGFILQKSVSTRLIDVDLMIFGEVPPTIGLLPAAN